MKLTKLLKEVQQEGANVKKSEKIYTTILNFDTGKIDVLDVTAAAPKNQVMMNNSWQLDVEEYIETVLDYSLSNCQWMTTYGKPVLNFLN